MTLSLTVRRSVHSLPVRAFLFAAASILGACNNGDRLIAMDGGNPSADDAGVVSVVADSGVPLAQSDAGVISLSAQGDGVSLQTTTVLGLAVDMYQWIDSRNRPRTVSFKRQGEGNPGNGGYAVQLTYEVLDQGQWKQVTVNQSTGADNGFGYFVSHEQARNFGPAGYATIASLHGEDDSPLGSSFPVLQTFRSAIAKTSTVASIRFEQRYPHWGTRVSMADVTAQVNPALDTHLRIELPVFIQWTFEKGLDFPRIDVKLDLSAVTPGQMAIDVRGPYGVLEIADSDASATLSNAQFGDSAFQFSTNEPSAGFLKSNSPWDWSQTRGNARLYHAMTAYSAVRTQTYEIGLIEQRLSGEPGLVNAGFGYAWNQTSATPNTAALVDLQWPFQSVQYSGLTATAAATSKKFAWGSASFYGSKTGSIFNGATNSTTPFEGRAGAALVYRTCLILTIPSLDSRSPDSISLTRVLANTPDALSCSSQLPLQ